MKNFSILSLVLLLALMALQEADQVSAQGHSTGFGTTREEILANRAKRKQQLEKMLEEAKSTMEDHTSGRRLLDDQEFSTLERKLNAYERKLETMSGEMDEKEVDRVLQREKLRYERDAARRAEQRQRGSEL